VRDGKPTKVPYSVTGRRAKSNDPRTWSTFEEVRKAYDAGGFDGIGFCLSDSDGLTGIDLDHVLDRATAEVVVPEAREILAHFADDYVERSPSGDGLRLWVIGRAARSGKAKGLPWIEVYTHPSSRYLTVTGHRFRFGSAM
jgi:primase-polymerase (primpol)-like protein